MQKPIRTAIGLAVVSMLSMTHAEAGSFSLYTEGSAAAIGNYGAGIAAEAMDASIGWYNPAGLVLIQNQQVLLGGVGVLASTQLTGTSTFTTPNPVNPLAPPFIYTQSFTDVQGAKTKKYDGY